MSEQSAISFGIKDNIATIEFDQPDSKVNVLTSDVLKKFDTILDEISRKSSLKALIITSKKKDIFIAGADIKEIEGITNEEEGKAKSKAGQDILNKLEDLEVPSIAVIDGAALGGGCELALACRYRIATFNEKVSIGCPEVKLGILPGFGGTYRIPRLVGLMQGLKLILSGKILSGKNALKSGLIDRLYTQKGLDAHIKKFIDEIDSSGSQKKKSKKNLVQAFLEKTPIGQIILFNESRKSVVKTTKGFYPAPFKILDVIKKSRGLKRSDALALEADGFGELVITGISKNLVKLFYLSEKYKKLTLKGADDIKPVQINKCGVLGAGVMGGGIAQILSYKGIWVRLKDINYDAIAKGLSAAHKIYKGIVKRRRLKKAQAQERMAHITGTLGYEGFKTTDMVIEAVVEDLNIKKKVFKELSSAVSPRTIICSNTSALSVTQMAQETKDPTKVIGLHFFNPVHRMPLIEVIRTDLTSDETIVSTLNLVKRLGKIPILVKDSCGFLVNRILLAYLNEAGRILQEGQKIETVDRIMTRFGMPMGPLVLCDEVGSDVGLKVLRILEDGFGERFKPVDIFEKIYEQKWLGRKSGRGFYIHKKKRRSPNTKVYQMLPEDSKFTAGEDEYLDRMVCMMINEAAGSLQDRIVDDPGAVDIGMIMGTGFPPFRGGLLRYADEIGISKVVDTLLSFQEKYKSDRFKPCRYLLDLKEQNKAFYQS